jgi:hypothetical protein
MATAAGTTARQWPDGEDGGRGARDASATARSVVTVPGMVVAEGMVPLGCELM